MFLGKLKSGVLSSAKRLGFFTIAKQSKWRQQRLLILCYHGLSMEDEHEWAPGLFISPQLFEQRLKLLRDYSVLSLKDALERLKEGSLPPASVDITFDDGLYDFRQCAYPLLQQYGFPATVYLTTYYSEKNLPIFPIALGYVLWKQVYPVPAYPFNLFPYVDLVFVAIGSLYLCTRPSIVARTRTDVEGLRADARVVTAGPYIHAGEVDVVGPVGAAEESDSRTV